MSEVLELGDDCAWMDDVVEELTPPPDPAVEHARHIERVRKTFIDITECIGSYHKPLAYIPDRLRGWEEVLDVITAMRDGGGGPAAVLAQSLDASTIEFFRGLKAKTCDIILQYSSKPGVGQREVQPVTLRWAIIFTDDGVRREGNVLGYRHCRGPPLSIDQEHVTAHCREDTVLFKRGRKYYEFEVWYRGVSLYFR